QRSERFFCHVPFALVREQPRRVPQRQPARLRNLVRGRGRQVAEPTARVPQEVEADDLEDSLAGPGVDVTDVAELADESCLDTRLFRHLAECRLLGLLPRADDALGERPDPGLLPTRPDRGHHPGPSQAPYEHSTGRELPSHKTFVTDCYLEGLGFLHSAGL